MTNRVQRTGCAVRDKETLVGARALGLKDDRMQRGFDSNYTDYTWRARG